MLSHRFTNTSVLSFVKRRYSLTPKAFFAAKTNRPPPSSSDDNNPSEGAFLIRNPISLIKTLFKRLTSEEIDELHRSLRLLRTVPSTQKKYIEDLEKSLQQAKFALDKNNTNHDQKVNINKHSLDNLWFQAWLYRVLTPQLPTSFSLKEYDFLPDQQLQTTLKSTRSKKSKKQMISDEDMKVFPVQGTLQTIEKEKAIDAQARLSAILFDFNAFQDTAFRKSIRKHFISDGNDSTTTGATSAAANTSNTTSADEIPPPSNEELANYKKATDTTISLFTKLTYPKFFQLLQIIEKSWKIKRTHEERVYDNDHHTTPPTDGTIDTIPTPTTISTRSHSIELLKSIFFNMKYDYDDCAYILMEFFDLTNHELKDYYDFTQLKNYKSLIFNELIQEIFHLSSQYALKKQEIMLQQREMKLTTSSSSSVVSAKSMDIKIPSVHEIMNFDVDKPVYQRNDETQIDSNHSYKQNDSHGDNRSQKNENAANRLLHNQNFYYKNYILGRRGTFFGRQDHFSSNYIFEVELQLFNRDKSRIGLNYEYDTNTNNMLAMTPSFGLRSNLIDPYTMRTTEGSTKRTYEAFNDVMNTSYKDQHDNKVPPEIRFLPSSSSYKKVLIDNLPPTITVEELKLKLLNFRDLNKNYDTLDNNGLINMDVEIEIFHNVPKNMNITSSKHASKQVKVLKEEKTMSDKIDNFGVLSEENLHEDDIEIDNKNDEISSEAYLDSVFQNELRLPEENQLRKLKKMTMIEREALNNTNTTNISHSNSAPLPPLSSMSDVKKYSNLLKTQQNETSPSTTEAVESSITSLNNNNSTVVHNEGDLSRFLILTKEEEEERKVQIKQILKERNIKEEDEHYERMKKLIEFETFEHENQKIIRRNQKKEEKLLLKFQKKQEQLRQQQQVLIPEGLPSLDDIIADSIKPLSSSSSSSSVSSKESSSSSNKKKDEKFSMLFEYAEEENLKAKNKEKRKKKTQDNATNDVITPTITEVEGEGEKDDNNNNKNSKKKKIELPPAKKAKKLTSVQKLQDLEASSEATETYAFVKFNNFQEYKNLMTDDVKIFGISIGKRICNVIPASKIRNLRIEVGEMNLNLVKLSTALNVDLGSEYDLQLMYNQRLLSNQMNSHDEAWSAYQLLKNRWKERFPLSRLTFRRTDYYYRAQKRMKEVLIGEMSKEEVYHHYEKMKEQGLISSDSMITRESFQKIMMYAKIHPNKKNKTTSTLNDDDHDEVNVLDLDDDSEDEDDDDLVDENDRAKKATSLGSSSLPEELMNFSGDVIIEECDEEEEDEDEDDSEDNENKEEVQTNSRWSESKTAREKDVWNEKQYEQSWSEGKDEDSRIIVDVEEDEDEGIELTFEEVEQLRREGKL